MSNIRTVSVLGLIALFLMAAGLTISAFYSFIIPDYRGQAFYASMAACCIAEFVFFGYLGCTRGGARTSPKHGDDAVRVRVAVLITCWTVIIIVTSGIAAAPGNADTFFSDKILFIQLFITFIAFLVVFFQHRQAVGVQESNALPQQERRRLESYAGGIDSLMTDVQALANREPDHLVAIEGLTRRLDTVKTQLQAVSAGTNDRDRPVAPADAALIGQRLAELHDEIGRLLSSQGEHLATQVQKARSAADRVLADLRQREDAMTF